MMKESEIQTACHHPECMYFIESQDTGLLRTNGFNCSRGVQKNA